MINFVSHLPADLRSGGFSAMNAAAFTALQKVAAVEYVGPINPRVDAGQKLRSKLARMAGGAGDFFQYSERRLDVIARQVAAKCAQEAQVDFFHGFTAWISTRPTRPYAAWSDCTFKDYIDIYHRRGAFRPVDLARIESAESAWLKGAMRIGFTSRWAADRAVAAYDLDPSRIDVVGIFGEIQPPVADAYAGGRAFAFVSTNFAAKGGPVVLEAFRHVRAHDPQATLTVVGDHPAGATAEPGVTFTGFLRKEDPVHLARFTNILSEARAIVHPTRSDIAPLLIVEAGYFGCPAISSRMFAIPELIDHASNGLLLDDPGDAGMLAEAMLSMLQEEEAYRVMRRNAWAKAHGQHSKAAFEDRLQASVLGPAAGMQA